MLTYVSNLDGSANEDADVEYYSKDNPMTLSEFLSNIISKTGGMPFCYSGIADFTQLEATAISKPPIDREPINGTSDGNYYPETPFLIDNKFTVLLGCAGKLHYQQISLTIKVLLRSITLKQALAASLSPREVLLFGDTVAKFYI